MNHECLFYVMLNERMLRMERARWSVVKNGYVNGEESRKQLLARRTEMELHGAVGVNAE